MKKLGVLAVLALSIPAVSGAQVATLLKDIHHEYVSESSDPIFLGSVAGESFFTAVEGGGAGRDLWVTHGTPEGTRLVDEACPDACKGYFTQVGALPGKLFLVRSAYASFGDVDRLISVTGGPVAAVTVLAADESTSFPRLWQPGASAILGSELFFSATAGANTVQLLASNGEAGGLRTLHTFDATASLFGFESVGSEIRFFREREEGLSELWATDGSAGGTRQVVTLDIPFEGSVIGSAAQRYLFTARDEAGIELWASDGSASGTLRLTDFPSDEPFFWNLQSSPTRAFFFVEDVSFGQELWVSDGTVAGTKAVTAFGFHEPFGNNFEATPLTVVGDRAFFYATDGLDGEQFWVATPAAASATVLATAPDPATSLSDLWSAEAGSQVFFLGDAPSTGTEVWTTDGTIAGTHIVWDACPGECNGGGEFLASSPSRLVYGAYGGHDSPFVTQAPWTSATDLYDAARSGPIVGSPQGVSALVDGTLIYFAARDANFGGNEPWVSRGQVASTFALADLVSVSFPSSEARHFVVAGSEVGFLANDEGSRTRIWLTEGTPSSTHSAIDADFPCLNHDTSLQAAGERLVAIGCQAQFSTVDPVSDHLQILATPDCFGAWGSEVIDGKVLALLDCASSPQVWKSDGTAGGTALTLSLGPTFYLQGTVSLVNQKLLFSGGPSAPRLYALNAAGTSTVALTPPDVVPDLAVRPEGEPLGFFTHQGQLWRTDGTPAGTLALGEARPGQLLEAAISSPSGYDLLFRTQEQREEIWQSNGTNAGTSLRATADAISSSAALLPIERVGNRLFFILGDYFDDPTLWVLEDSGSTAVALHVASMSGLFADSSFLAETDGQLIFSGCDPTHGCELWVSDGTIAGTHMLQDIYPGLGSSYPSEFTQLGSTLYFDADDGLHGPEPWSLSGATATGCRTGEQNLCLESNRFQVTATWRNFSGASGDATAVPISGDTGYFWFFDDANIELVLKLIDGTGTNGHHWVYYGALSNVEYTFTVTDSETGAAKRYFNPATRFASSGDIEAFGPLGAHASGGPAEAMTRAATPPEVSLAAYSEPQGLPGACVPTATRFCILNHRFAVTATWRDFAGHTGTANAGTLTDDTGYLWFFDEANVEVVLKMVDASDFNAHFWVYYGALSNVEYTLTVTDTVAGGPPRIYHNALGHFGSFGDIEAFPAP